VVVFVFPLLVDFVHDGVQLIGAFFLVFANSIAVLIDGKESSLDISQGYRRFGLLLPPGRHNVTAVLESTVTYGIDITSFWSSWLIVGFGLLAGSALFLLYIIVRISRPSEATI